MVACIKCFLCFICHVYLGTVISSIPLFPMVAMFCDASSRLRGGHFAAVICVSLFVSDSVVAQPSVGYSMLEIMTFVTLPLSAVCILFIVIYCLRQVCFRRRPPYAPPSDTESSLLPDKHPHSLKELCDFSQSGSGSGGCRYAFTCTRVLMGGAYRPFTATP